MNFRPFGIEIVEIILSHMAFLIPIRTTMHGAATFLPRIQFPTVTSQLCHQPEGLPVLLTELNCTVLHVYNSGIRQPYTSLCKRQFGLNILGNKMNALKIMLLGDSEDYSQSNSRHDPQMRRC